ncbi:MAG: hypothetical protein RR090_12600, partial [Niameybacter sp.]
MPRPLKKCPYYEKIHQCRISALMDFFVIIIVSNSEGDTMLQQQQTLNSSPYMKIYDIVVP